MRNVFPVPRLEGSDRTMLKILACGLMKMACIRQSSKRQNACQEILPHFPNVTFSFSRIYPDLVAAISFRHYIPDSVSPEFHEPFKVVLIVLSTMVFKD